MITIPPQTRQQIRSSRRIQKKTENAQEKEEALLSSKINNLLNQVLPETELIAIAKKTNFLCRSRKLTPFAIIAILLMGCLNGTENIASLEIMCCFLRKWFEIDLLPQSLQEKINSKECAEFVKAVTIKVMTHEVNKAIAKLLKKKKKSKLFHRILLQDSTVISLPETVSRIFRGCGGSASKAAVKCDIILDQQNHLILKCKCFSGRIPDVCASEDILNVAEERDLIIRDMGYFNLTHFAKLIQNNIWFISRLKNNIHIYLNKDDEDPVEIIEYLDKLIKNKTKIDLDLYIGKKERVPVRLVGIKVPKEIVEERRNQYIKAHGRKKTPSEDLLQWYEYTLMVTNISRNSLSLNSVIKIYKIRWQIELFFKNMKSQLKIDNFTGKNKYRILCILYSKLIMTWITALLFAFVQSKAQERYAISPVKFTKWLRDVGNWQKAIAEENFNEIIEDFERDMDLLKKTIKRKPHRYIEKGRLH